MKNKANGFEDCTFSVDKTDFSIQLPTSFSFKRCPHTCRGAGYRYEIWIPISNGRIVWVNDPFGCGEWPDIKMF